MWELRWVFLPFSFSLLIVVFTNNSFCRLLLEIHLLSQIFSWSTLSCRGGQETSQPNCFILEPQGLLQGWGHTPVKQSKESWALKNWCFWTVVLEKFLESFLDSKEIKSVNPKGNQSWIFFGRTDVKLKLQYFGHLMWITDSLKKTLMLGKTEGGRGRGQWRTRCWMASPTQRTWVWVSSGSWWWAGKPGLLQSMGSQRVGHDWVTELRRKCWEIPVTV